MHNVYLKTILLSHYGVSKVFLENYIFIYICENDGFRAVSAEVARL